jgi:hypothetical protein
MDESNEIVILLPGEVNGVALVLAETSASNVSINRNLVPSLITKVWWNEDIIITQNHPMQPRNKFLGDTYQQPVRSVLCWYVVNPQDDKVTRFDDYDRLTEHVTSLGIDSSAIKFLRLHEAQRLREKQLGFKFTAASVNRYVRSQPKAAMRR